MRLSAIETLTRQWGHVALNFALPPRCVLCGTMEVDSVNFCLSCWSALRLQGGDGCATCHRPMPDDGPAALLHEQQCAACLASPPMHDGLWSATAYDDNSGAIAMKLKYGKKVGLARHMARLMQRHLPDDAADWLLVPVPLHRWRIWGRGFNQAALIADELARLSGARTMPDALLRRRATQVLGHMRGEERRRELRHAITAHPKRGQWIRHANIILIDDVVTSGATSDACVSALKNAGARSVRVLCWARVLPEIAASEPIKWHTEKP